MLRYFPGIQHGFLCTPYLQKTLCDADLARSHAILCDRVCMFSITSRFLFLPYISIFVIFPSFSFDIKKVDHLKQEYVCIRHTHISNVRYAPFLILSLEADFIRVSPYLFFYQSESVS